MMNNESMKPTIRFKGFTEAWEQRKLSEMYYLDLQNNSLSRADLSSAARFCLECSLW